jgi:hypothetical protein
VCDAGSTLLPRADGPPQALRPDPDVLGALVVLEQRFTMTLVTEADAAATETRLASCGMTSCFPAATRFARQPGDGDAAAPYRRAVADNHCFTAEALAVIASPRAACAAQDAGLRVVGNLQYVEPDDRPQLTRLLLEVGVEAVVTSWEHLMVALLD